MSHALKRLRILLGDPLLVRVGSGMQLTARGQALRYPVKDVLSRVRDLLVMETFDAARSTRTFHLFVSDYASDLLFPLLRKQLQHEAPSISIRVQQGGAVRVESVELARAVDVAITCVPSSFKGFYQQRLFIDRDACAVRHGNPITSAISRKAEFLKLKHVAVVGREFREDPVDTWLSPGRLATKRSVNCSSLPPGIACRGPVRSHRGRSGAPHPCVLPSPRSRCAGCAAGRWNVL